MVLPYINMQPPRVYTCSPSWTPLGWQLPGKHADAAAAFCGWRPTGSSPRAARSGCSRWAHVVPTSACRCALSRSSPQSSVWEPCPCPGARTWRRGLRLQCNQSVSRERLADDLIHSHSVNWQDFLRVNPDSEWAVSAACISSQGSRGESGLPWTWGFLLHCADCFSKLLQGPQLRWKALPEYWELVWETRHLVQAVETTLGEAEFQSSRQLLLGKAQLREDLFSHSQSWLCQLWVKWFPEKLSLSKSSFLWELFYWKAVENLLAMM